MRTRETKRDQRQDVLLQAPRPDAARDVDSILVPRVPQKPVPRIEVRNEVRKNGVVRFEASEEGAEGADVREKGALDDA